MRTQHAEELTAARATAREATARGGAALGGQGGAALGGQGGAARGLQRDTELQCALVEVANLEKQVRGRIKVARLSHCARLSFSTEMLKE